MSALTEDAARALICEIGRRLYARGFASGNDGNLSIRLSPDAVLCTPTLICKGFMSPADLCTVDMNGRRLSGDRPRTSEILLHLEIYRGDPQTRAVVHCHPPHATAFGIARVDIPTGVLPEGEVFLGVVPRAAYETPGSEAFAASVRPFVGQATACVLSNHGTVSWAADLERAYWYTEMLDSYCRMLMLARLLGHVERLPEDKVRELLALRAAFGMAADPRADGSTPLYVNPGFGKPGAPGP
ncbi:MAG: class II aldolase/adducin family protein [Phycisphaerae bacterium]|jgi:L-fuculose-phosphate aldolase|nr:class II aldolase/adducin family protein [Phycisphaerae bacterium]MCZ2398463.1 class II aldolase/adducin family protein [Phycisphaerae bacterium]